MTTAARLGRNLLIKDGLLVGSATIAAMRETSFTINGASVDVTDKDSVNQYRELLAGAGTVSVRLTARGLLHGNAQAQTLVSRAIARSLDDYRLEFDNGDNITGKFQLTSFDASGAFDGEQVYSLTFESGGALTFTGA